jgi:hypothetical protein
MPSIPAAGGFGIGLPPDPLTLQGAGAVFLGDAIDPQTGEYLSILKGWDPVDAAAVEALRVRRASGSAVTDDGNKLHEIEVIDERLEFLATSEVKYAWRRLIEAKLIRLASVKLQDDGDVGALLTVKYNNLFSGKSQTIPLPIEDRFGAL